MNMHKRILAICVLLLFTTCFQGISEAQKESPSWKVIDIAMSHDGRYLLVKSGVASTEHPNAASEIWVYDLESLLLPPRFLTRDFSTGSRMLISPNNQYLALGGLFELSIFDIPEGANVFRLERTSTEPPTDFVWTAFSPDSNYIMSFSDWWFRENKMFIWNIHTGQRVHGIDAERGREQTYYTLLSPDWSRFVRWSEPSYEGGQTLIFEFDIENGLGQQLASLGINGARSVFSPDGSLLAVATEEGSIGEAVKILVYETETWNLRISALTGARICSADVGLRFSRDNSILLFTYSCLLDDWLSLWNLATDELVIEAQDAPFSPFSFSENSEYMLGDGDFGIAVWNIEKGFELTEYPGRQAAIHPNGEILASIGPDGRVWIWNIRSQQLLVILPAPRR